MAIITQKIEDKALEMAMPEAQSRAKDFLCTDCLDRRCLSGQPCKVFSLASKSYAWDIIAEKAELN